MIRATIIVKQHQRFLIPGGGPSFSSSFENLTVSWDVLQPALVQGRVLGFAGDHHDPFEGSSQMLSIMSILSIGWKIVNCAGTGERKCGKGNSASIQPEARNGGGCVAGNRLVYRMQTSCYEGVRRRSSAIVDHITPKQKAAARPTEKRANSPKTSSSADDVSTRPRKAN
jgi:hypothetical protein